MVSHCGLCSPHHYQLAVYWLFQSSVFITMNSLSLWESQGPTLTSIQHRDYEFDRWLWPELRYSAKEVSPGGLPTEMRGRGGEGRWVG